MRTSLLSKLQKRAAIIPPEKKRSSFWGRALPAAALGAGIAGAGYLGYKALNPTARTPLPPGRSPTFGSAYQEAAKNSDKFLSSLHADDPDTTGLERAAYKGMTVDAGLTGAGWGAGLSNWATKGRVGGGALGKALIKYPNTPWLSKIPGAANIPALSRVTPITAMSAVPNVIDAYHDYDSAAGKAMGMTAATALPFMPGGVPLSAAAYFDKMLLQHAGGLQEDQANTEGQLADLLVNTYSRMRATKPQLALQGRQDAQYLLHDPRVKNLMVDPALHPGLWRRMALYNFGQTPGASGVGMHNTAPTRVLMGKMQQMLNQQQ